MPLGLFSCCYVAFSKPGHTTTHCLVWWGCQDGFLNWMKDDFIWVSKAPGPVGCLEIWGHCRSSSVLIPLIVSTFVPLQAVENKTHTQLLVFFWLCCFTYGTWCLKLFTIGCVLLDYFRRQSKWLNYLLCKTWSFTLGGRWGQTANIPKGYLLWTLAGFYWRGDEGIEFVIKT